LLALSGDEGARSILHDLPTASLVAIDAPELAFDIDRPEDLDALTSPR
jgi:CTP:molybdopterin cytidylyltransferase MocA